MSDETIAKLKSANDAAEHVTANKAPGSPTVRCPLMDKHWLEIEMLNEDGKPVANEPYLIIDSEEHEYRGKTDATGVARVSGIAEGQCRITFTDLDQDSWDGI